MKRLAVALASVLLLSSCGHNFDVEKVVKITDVHTGWYDAGIFEGKNKLDRQGIPPGETGGSLVLRSNLGYTGTESRLQMLQNKQFVDAKVEIFGKHGSRTWQKLGEFTIDRQLLTQ